MLTAALIIATVSVMANIGLGITFFLCNRRANKTAVALSRLQSKVGSLRDEQTKFNDHICKTALDDDPKVIHDSFTMARTIQLPVFEASV